LLSQGKDEEALEVVRWIYRTNKGVKDHKDMNIEKLTSEITEQEQKDKQA